jgi:hypothetical protein
MQPPICCGVQRVGLAQFRRAFLGAQHRLVLTQPELRRASLLAAGDSRFAWRRLAFGADHVGLPVVEEQLRGLADHLFGLFRIAHVRQRDVDFVRPRALDFRLRHAQLVDALTHDVDRAVQRFGVDFRLRGGLGLVDELDAALQVEAQAGLFRSNDCEGRGDQPGDDQQDQPVAAAVGHCAPIASSDYLSGVSTSNRPPSSS